MDRETRSEVIKAMGYDNYRTLCRLMHEGAICPYDEAFTVKEMFEETRGCLHCHVRQCEINK